MSHKKQTVQVSQKTLNNMLIIVGLVLIVGFGFMVFSKDGAAPSANNGAATAKMENGKQVVEVTAKGGYSPGLTTATADTPTTLRVKTNNTFDCSTALVIPTLNIREFLKANGVAEFEIPPQKAGTTINATCSMGMYRFAINFV